MRVCTLYILQFYMCATAREGEWWQLCLFSSLWIKQPAERCVFSCMAACLRVCHYLCLSVLCRNAGVYEFCTPVFGFDVSLISFAHHECLFVSWVAVCIHLKCAFSRLISWSCLFKGHHPWMSGALENSKNLWCATSCTAPISSIFASVDVPRFVCILVTWQVKGIRVFLAP